jgi:hypothetical protein
VTFENPAEMDLAFAAMTRAIGGVSDDLRLPVADELAIELQRLGTIGGGTFGEEGCGEAGIESGDGRPPGGAGRCKTVVRPSTGSG